MATHKFSQYKYTEKHYFYPSTHLFPRDHNLSLCIHHSGWQTLRIQLWGMYVLTWKRNLHPCPKNNIFHLSFCSVFLGYYKIYLLINEAVEYWSKILSRGEKFNGISYGSCEGFIHRRGSHLKSNNQMCPELSVSKCFRYVRFQNMTHCSKNAQGRGNG